MEGGRSGQKSDRKEGLERRGEKRRARQRLASQQCKIQIMDIKNKNCYFLQCLPWTFRGSARQLVTLVQEFKKAVCLMSHVSDVN